MIAVLDRCWLRATTIEARSQGGKSCCRCCWLLLELLGLGVGFAGAIACFAGCASPLQAAFQMMRAARESQEGMPEGLAGPGLCEVRWW